MPGTELLAADQRLNKSTDPDLGLASEAGNVRRDAEYPADRKVFCNDAAGYGNEPDDNIGEEVHAGPV